MSDPPPQKNYKPFLLDDGRNKHMVENDLHYEALREAFINKTRQGSIRLQSRVPV